MISHKERLPFWLKILGCCVRRIPNFYKFKQGVVMASKLFIAGRGYNTVIKFDLGQKILLNLDDWIPLQIFWSGMYLTEKIETTIYKKFVKKGDVVIDIGAHIGYYTLMATVRVGKEGQVYSFEPNPFIFKILEKNIQINRFKNIYLCNMALSNKKGFEHLYIANSPNTGSTSIFSIDNFSKKITVKTTTLDNFAKQQNIKEIDIIKIDVEGAELKVLEGSKKIISKYNPKILIEIRDTTLSRSSKSYKDIYKFLTRFNYKAYDIRTLKLLRRKIEGGLILFSKDRIL